MKKNSPDILKGKLLELLKTFSNKELKRLESYIMAPFINTNKKIIQVLQYIKAYHPSYKEINKLKLYKKLFGATTPYQDSRLRVLISSLSRLVEQFMAYQKYEQDPYRKQSFLLDSLIDRHLFKYYDQQFDSTQKELQKSSLRNIDYYYWQFWLAESNHRHVVLQDNRSSDDSLQKIMDQLDRYYVVEKLHYHWLALNRQRVVQQEYNQGFFWAEINQLIQVSPLADEALIRLYRQMIDVLEEPEKEEHFIGLRKVFEHNKDILTADEQQQVYAVLINYCRWQSSRGESKYMLVALDLYKKMFEGGLLHVGSYISPQHFKNIVFLALQVDDLDWVGKFLENNWKGMHPNHANNVYAYNKAALYFHQEKFDEAADLLRQIQFSDFEFIDFYYHIDYKILLIKTYYNTNEESPLIAALEALRIYLMRHKGIATNQRTAYLNFIKLTKRLINEKRGKKRQSKDNLEDAIRKTEPLFQRHWLLDKYNELAVSNG